MRFRRPPHSPAPNFPAMVRVLWLVSHAPRAWLRFASGSHPPADGNPDGVYDALTDIGTILTTLARCSAEPCIPEPLE